MNVFSIVDGVVTTDVDLKATSVFFYQGRLSYGFWLAVRRHD